jgi:hypothetical protein
MLTVYTSTCCRPDYVQLLACALSRTVTEPYRFVVVLHPGGIARDWDSVDEVIAGQTSGYMAWQEVLPMIDGPSVILHDDCVPVLPWSSQSFIGPHVIRFAGHTIQYHAGPASKPAPVLMARRVTHPSQCPPEWPEEVCRRAAAARAEYLLDGVFLHIDKGTIVHPDAEPNEGKPALVAAIAAHLGCDVPSPLTHDELAAHPGRRVEARPGLGDMVSAGLSAIGITPERVSKALGVKDCGCRQRAEALNRIGRRLGIG